MARPKRPYTLTESAVVKFLSCLDPDPVTAEERYEQLYRRLVRLFEWNSCTDPERATDETIDRAIRKVDEGATVTDVAGLLFGIARNVQKELRRRAVKSVPITVDLPAPDNQSSEVEEQVRCLERCLGRLKPENRSLFHAYYGGVDRKELPAQFGATINALRIRVLKVKDGLQKCFTSCIQGSAG